MSDDPASGVLADILVRRRAIVEHLAEERMVEAIRDLTALLAITPDDPIALEERAWAYMHTGQIVEARADADRLAGAFPDSAQALAVAGELYLTLQAPDEGRPLLERALALAGPAGEEIRFRVAQGYERAGIADRALALYDALVGWHPRAVLLARGRLRGSTGDTAGALADLDRALAEPPDDGEETAETRAQALIDRAHIHFGMSRWGGVQADAQAALDLLENVPLAAEAWSLLASCAQIAGDLPFARHASEQAVHLDPRQELAWMTLSTTYVAEGDAEGALDVLHRGQALNPLNHNLVLTAVLLRTELSDHEGVVAEWDRLLAQTPADPTALAMRGTALVRLGRHAAAGADLARALALEPTNVIALQGRADLLMEDEKPADAVAVLNQALALQPTDTDVLLQRAEALVELEDLTGAGADFARVLELDPENDTALSGLGMVQMAQGQFTQALRSYEAAQRLDPAAPIALYNLAMAQAALNHCPQALDLLRRAVTADPDLLAEARNDPFLDSCRRQPGFVALLRGRPAPPTPPPKKKAKRKR